jgi:hypothetical protein
LKISEFSENWAKGNEHLKANEYVWPCNFSKILLEYLLDIKIFTSSHLISTLGYNRINMGIGGKGETVPAPHAEKGSKDSIQHTLKFSIICVIAILFYGKIS